MPKRFNPIRDDLPTKTEINGHIYNIKSDYRIGFDYYNLMMGEELDEIKRAYSLAMFFGDVVYKEDVEELFMYIEWFLSRGTEKEKTEREEKTFDLLEDSGKIYSAFMQVYQINLRSVKMHWWIFLELFEGLPSGTYLASVIELRSRKASKEMSAEDRVSLAKAQEYHRIGEKKDLFACGVTRGIYGI